jgi:hypothetical protein
MLTPRKASLLLSIAALVGCTSGSDQNVTGLISPPSDARLAAGGVQQQVTGHANIELPAFGNAVERYSQSAIRHADGTVSGQFELSSEQDGGLRIHGDVFCFTVVGNTVRLGGQIDQSDADFIPVGSYVVWTIVDNGEGANSPPDLTTDFLGPTSQAVAAAHCLAGFNLGPFYPVSSGNLQVH